jgi:PAS domain S-box-containing protein
VHQIELEVQNEELRHSRADVEAGLERYTTLYDFAPVGYVTLDHGGRILQVTLTGARLLGVERAMLMGRRFGLFVADGERSVLNAFLQKVFESRIKQVCEVALPKEGGQSRWVAIEAIATEDGKECYAVVSDISEHKRLNDAQLFLVKCGWSASGEAFFEALARYLAESLGMDFVCIDRLVGDGLNAQTVAVYFDGKFEDSIEYVLKDTPCGDVVGHTICCFPRDVRRLFPKDAVLQDMAAESYVGTTLWGSKGQPIGPQSLDAIP